MFKNESGDWKKFRELQPQPVEVDFHWSEFGSRHTPYWEVMAEVWDVALEALQTAYDGGTKYVLLTHGWSTSRRGTTTARSQVRKLMRSKEATPYICRRQCIQHRSVFLAAIRPKTQAMAEETLAERNGNGRSVQPVAPPTQSRC